MSVVFLGLGSNMGDRRANLKAALRFISSHPCITLLKISSFYETAPVGYTDQPDFLNAVAQVKTGLTPCELLGFLQRIENRLKRVRTVRWGPRTIDLDILLFDEEVIEEKDLVIPHPRMAERLFVLEPLAEIAPGAVHPVSGKTAEQLLRECKKRSSNPSK